MRTKIKPIIQNYLLIILSAATTQSAQCGEFIPTATLPMQGFHAGYRHYGGRTEPNFYANFEPASFSGKQELTVHFIRLKNGTIIFGKSSPENIDKKNQFYCQQALSEIIPVATSYGDASQYSLTFPPLNQQISAHDCVNIFFNKYAALQDKTVAMHIIPPSVAVKFPDLFTEAELHGLKNLVGLDAKFIDSDDLAFYRVQWADYLSSADAKQITRQAITLKAGQLLTQHKKMFFYLDTVIPIFQTSLAESGGGYNWIPNPYKKPFHTDEDSDRARDMRRAILLGKVTQHEKERITRAARDAADHGDYGRALKYFEQFRDSYKDASLISEEVICLEKLHLREKAILLLRSMVKNKSAEMKVYQNFVDYEISAGKFNDALALCDDIKQITTYDTDDIVLLRVKILLAMKNKKAATDVLLERYFHNVRAGSEQPQIMAALSAEGIAKPTKVPENHGGDEEAFKTIEKGLHVSSIPNGRELCYIFEKDFENIQDGQNDWSWQNADLPVNYLCLATSGNGAAQPALTIRLNSDSTHITSKMLAEKFAVPETELSPDQVYRDARFYSSSVKLRVLNKKLEDGGIAFAFSALDSKQLTSITRYWTPNYVPKLTYHETDLNKNIEDARELIKNGKYESAKELISSHWNDSYFEVNTPEAKRAVLEQNRKLLIEIYSGEKKSQVCEYLRSAPLALITQDLANHCTKNNLPAQDEYIRNKWLVRGSVESADSKNAYYQVGKAGYPNIRVKAETPLFRVIYPIIGDTSFSKTTLLNSEAIPANLFDDVYYSSAEKQ
jgi:hypothetical protein